MILMMSMYMLMMNLLQHNCKSNNADAALQLYASSVSTAVLRERERYVMVSVCKREREIEGKRRRKGERERGFERALHCRMSVSERTTDD